MRPPSRLSKSSPRQRGFTVLEMFVALSIFSLIMIVTTFLLQQSVSVWTSGDSRENASINLQKARSALMRDLVGAAAKPSADGKPHMAQAQLPTALGGGDALWFLSAKGPNGEFVRDEDGFPFWQRNILYYLVIPQGHDQMYGTTLQLGSNPQGDDQCPHKLLIRMEIDRPPATAPLPAPPTPAPAGAQPESLLTQAEVSDYLKAPQGLDVSALLALPNVKEVRIISTGLLWFKVNPAPGAPTEGRRIDLRAVAVKEAFQQAPVGSVPLLNSPATLWKKFVIFPNN